MSVAEAQGRPAGSTRRGLLGRIALLAGGAATGAGIVAGGRLRGEPAAAGPVPQRRRTSELVLRGRNWRGHAPGSVPGRRPDPAAEPVTHGVLVDGAERPVGRFRAAALPGPVGAFHLHTFELTDGTLFGLGAGALREGTFALVGGTGAFAGVGGTYVARQFPRELGGDGTAEFTITITAPEA